MSIGLAFVFRQRATKINADMPLPFLFQREHGTLVLKEISPANAEDIYKTYSSIAVSSAVSFAATLYAPTY